MGLVAWAGTAPASVGFDGTDTTRTEEANGAVTTVAYGFGQPAGGAVEQLQVLTTDALGHQRALYRDVQSRVVAVEERISGRKPTTHYGYNPLGELTKVVDAAEIFEVPERAYEVEFVDAEGRTVIEATLMEEDLEVVGDDVPGAV